MSEGRDKATGRFAPGTKGNPGGIPKRTKVLIQHLEALGDEADARSDAAPDAGEADLRKCLTKEYLPDRSVVFKDSCTKESASTARSAPVMNDFSPPPKVSQSIRLEPLMANDDVPQQMDGP